MEPSQEGPPPLPDLIASLEHATLMAKQLPITTDPSQALQVYSSLQSLHHQLGLFLSQFHQSSSHPQLGGEHSVSSAVGQENEPMEIGDEEVAEEGEITRVVLDRVEERIRNFALQNKRRRKRPLSPSSLAVDQRPLCDSGGVVLQGYPALDPERTLLRSLDLVFQFHG